MLIGVANSIAKGKDFDPLYTYNFVYEHNFFSIIQIYLNKFNIYNYNFIQFYKIYSKNANTISLLYHLDDTLEKMIQELDEEYLVALRHSFNNLSHEGYVIHINMTEEIIVYQKILKKLKGILTPPFCLELVFNAETARNPQDSFNDFFRLISMPEIKDFVKPVLDIPRFFHKQLPWVKEEALQNIIEGLNYLNEHKITPIFHLIDVTSNLQKRKHFCALGRGILPLDQILEYQKKLGLQFHSIILEHEDPESVIESIPFLQKYFL